MYFSLLPNIKHPEAMVDVGDGFINGRSSETAIR